MKSSELLALFAGNRALKDRLCPLLDSGTLPHALLLTGEDGCGRNFLARLIARSLLADEHDLVGRAAHPDCIVVEGEGASNQITVRRVREAAYELQKSPVMNDCGRVAIIKNAASLNKSSSNALLKIIEQPPDGVTFLLTARSEAELLETILSRCVRLRVEPLEPQEFEERFYARENPRLRARRDAEVVEVGKESLDVFRRDGIEVAVASAIIGKAVDIRQIIPARIVRQTALKHQIGLVAATQAGIIPGSHHSSPSSTAVAMRSMVASSWSFSGL